MKVGPRQSWSVFGDLYFWPGRPVRSAITVRAGADGADGAAGAVFRDTVQIVHSSKCPWYETPSTVQTVPGMKCSMNSQYNVQANDTEIKCLHI